MNSNISRASALVSVALTGACGGVAAPTVIGAPATAHIDEAQSSGASAQVAINTPAGPTPCATPCTISLLSGVQLWNVARPNGDQRVLLASVEPGEWRYQLRYRNRPMFITGAVFNVIGLTAATTSTIMLTLRTGAIPLIVTASVGVLFLSLGLGFTVGAGSDVAVRVPAAGPTARRAPRATWALAPVIDPTLVGATYALRF